MRIAFATNDERTAKRISEALGTATELRAQRNYAGHRLAPWLGHLMVSRQETARPLLTPGEVMQLPPDEEVVMVSGHPPIKAAKLRYYQDRNFMGRMLAPPVLALDGYADKPTARPDDWSGLAIPAVSGASTTTGSGGFADEGGHQLKPELDVAFDTPTTMDVDDLLVLDDEDDMSLQPHGLKRNKRDMGETDQRMQRTARLAALDPDDGIAL